MQIGEGETREASSTVDAEEQEHEEHLTRLDNTRQVFKQQRVVEGAFVFGIKGCYLRIDIM